MDGVGWSGQKIGHKINSIQPAEYSLLLGSNISRRSPLRGRVGSFSRGGRNNGTLYRAPGAQSQHPYIIIHTGKKAGGTFAERKRLGDGAELSRHPEHSASSIFRTYREITSRLKVNFSAIYINFVQKRKCPEIMIVPSAAVRKQLRRYFPYIRTTIPILNYFHLT